MASTILFTTEVMNTPCLPHKPFYLFELALQCKGVGVVFFSLYQFDLLCHLQRRYQSVVIKTKNNLLS